MTPNVPNEAVVANPHEKIVFQGLETQGFDDINVYAKNGGYETWREIITNRIPPEHIVDLVKKSGLRGRGGAGFQTGLKWSFIKRDSEGEVFLLCNADESEPGTFKDREIMVQAPHQLIEGMLLAAYAIGAKRSYIYIRGEFEAAWKKMEEAIRQATERGYLGHNILGSLFDHQIYTHRGGGTYICGEETALIESLEGRRGTPRHKPPYPAAKGFFGHPTVVNNVETLAAVPAIVKNGPIWYRQWGTFRSPGTKLFSVCGHAENKGVYELPLGFPAREFYEDIIGGCAGGKELKAVFVGGTSVPIMPAKNFLAANLDYESIAEHGGALGSGALILMDEDTDMVKMAKVLARFYKHESCGLCTPCRVGTSCAYDMLLQLVSHKGQPRDLDTLDDLMDVMPITSNCGLGQTAPLPIATTMKYYRDEFVNYVKDSDEN